MTLRIEQELPLFYYRRYLSDKVIDDFNFLKLLTINLFRFAHQNSADKEVKDSRIVVHCRIFRIKIRTFPAPSPSPKHLTDTSGQ